MTEQMHDELNKLADDHFSAVLAQLPLDAMERFLLFVEVVRTVDYWSVVAKVSSDRLPWSEHQLDLMHWGWNQAIAALFEPLPVAERVNEFATPGCLLSVSKRQILCGFGIPSFWVG